MDRLLEVSGLQLPGLPPIDFELAAGECLAVRGPSGSGKTLLLRALADLDDRPGDVTLAGERRADVPAPEWRTRVAYVSSEPGWWAEEVRSHFADWDAVLPLVETLGLRAEMGDHPVARLSTGERQRLGLARAFVRDPRVLLLDEPTASLDAAATEIVEELVRTRLATGVGALLVSHDVPQAGRLARRVLHIRDGSITVEEA